VFSSSWVQKNHWTLFAKPLEQSSNIVDYKTAMAVPDQQIHFVSDFRTAFQYSYNPAYLIEISTALRGIT
jgi:hypothetical protein